jgi:hypothetical protein
MHRIEISKLFTEFVSKYEIVCDACETDLLSPTNLSECTINRRNSTQKEEKNHHFSSLIPSYVFVLKPFYRLAHRCMSVFLLHNSPEETVRYAC